MSSIQFVYFDLDDTLLDHRHAEREALRDTMNHFPELFGAFTIDTVHDTYHRINKPLWEDYAAGLIDKATVRASRFRNLLETLDADPTFASDVNRYYLERYGMHWQYIPGAEDAFAQIAEQYDVGILTNGFAETQTKKMEQFPLLQSAARAVIICEEVGHLKPHPAVFEHAATQVQVDPASILYVGDSYTSDVEGSARAGWKMAWYVRNGSPAEPISHGFSFSNWSTLLERVVSVCKL